MSSETRDQEPQEPNVFYVSDGDGGTVSESAFVQKLSITGETEGVRVERGDDDPRSASADLDEAGAISDWIAGASSPKASRELRAAQLLVQHLNGQGAVWLSAEMRCGREDGVDCVALDRAGNKLEMQTTVPEHTAWAELATAERIERTESADAAAAEIRVAIERKQRKAHRSVVLVIDATDSPRYVLTAVVERFRQPYASVARESGFASVWLVGPTLGTVYQLDV